MILTCTGANHHRMFDGPVDLDVAATLVEEGPPQYKWPTFAEKNQVEVHYRSSLFLPPPSPTAGLTSGQQAMLLRVPICYTKYARKNQNRMDVDYHPLLLYCPRLGGGASLCA